MKNRKNEGSNISIIKGMLDEGRIDRREFLRTATLLGLSATAAYSMAGLADATTGGDARAEDEPIKRGGTIRVAMNVQEFSDPAAIDWVNKSNIARQFLEYVTMTGPDNITRPYLAESWDVSEDLKTWTFKLRPGIKWSNGDALTADHVLWNIKRWLDPKTGSSMYGLLSALMVEGADGKMREADGALEKVDDLTFRLNLVKPDLSIPEALYHYPALIAHPASEVDGKVDVRTAPISTGPFRLVNFEVGVKAELERNPDYWGGPDYVAGGPYLDKIVFVDLGDDPGANLAAFASDQVDLLDKMDITQLQLAMSLPNARLVESHTANTAVARMQMNTPPYDDQRIRQAIQACIDHARLLELTYQGRGLPAEDHHLAPVHPEYVELPKPKQDHEKAKKLLAEAGHENGISVTMNVNNNEPWQVALAQAMVEMMRPAGITLNLQILPGPQFWDVWTEAPFSLTGWSHRPLGVMVYNLAYRKGAPWNESRHDNPEFDAALDEANGLVDPEARKVPMERAAKLLQESGVISQPYWRSLFTVAATRVKGYEYHPTEYHNFFRTWIA